MKQPVHISNENLILVTSQFKKVIADYFNTTIENIDSKCRAREGYIYPRQLTQYFLRMLTDLTLVQIGKNVGSNDHATVINSCRTIDNLLSYDKKTKIHVSYLEGRLVGVLQVLRYRKKEVQITKTEVTSILNSMKLKQLDDKKINQVIDINRVLFYINNRTA